MLSEKKDILYKQTSKENWSAYINIRKNGHWDNKFYQRHISHNKRVNVAEKYNNYMF